MVAADSGSADDDLSGSGGLASGLLVAAVICAMSAPSSKPVEIVPGLVVSDPQIHHGAPVFLGTDVMVKTLLDYRDGHSPLYEFLLDFPEVKPWQAKKFLEWWAEQEKLGVQDVLGWLLALREERHYFGQRSKSAGPKRDR
jgi:uncharacterized protein (DUF433 family)